MVQRYKISLNYELFSLFRVANRTCFQSHEHAHSGSVNSLACFQHLVPSLEGHEHATFCHRIEPTEGGVLLEFA